MQGILAAKHINRRDWEAQAGNILGQGLGDQDTETEGLKMQLVVAKGHSGRERSELSGSRLTADRLNFCCH